MSHAEIVGLEHFWGFFLIGAMGGASVELLKLYEYRNRLTAAQVPAAVPLSALLGGLIGDDRGLRIHGVGRQCFQLGCESLATGPLRDRRARAHSRGGVRQGGQLAHQAWRGRRRRLPLR